VLNNRYVLLADLCSTRTSTRASRHSKRKDGPSDTGPLFSVPSQRLPTSFWL
jgi:hypothetical protein